jgi:adiponectin receptor
VVLAHELVESIELQPLQSRVMVCKRSSAVKTSVGDKDVASVSQAQIPTLVQAVQAFNVAESDLNKQGNVATQSPFIGSTIDPVAILPRMLYRPLCLCSMSDVPPWQSQLAGIHHGYRTTYTFYDAFMSLFYWHNESMNIWIHYVGTGLLAWRGWHYGGLILQHETSSEQPMFEKLLLIVSIIMGCVLPIFFSAVCHNFYCISQRWHKLFWFLDFFGILSGITWGALNFIFLAFYSNLPMQMTLAILIFTGKFFAINYCWKPFSKRMDVIPLHPKDRMPEFSFVLSSFSLFSYSLTIIPTLYYHSAEYFNHPALFEVAMKSCLFPLGMALGIVLFAQGHIPERFTGAFGVSRDYFDFFGHSHQCWHVLSFALLFFAIEVTYQHYDARVNDF